MSQITANTAQPHEADEGDSEEELSGPLAQVNVQRSTFNLEDRKRMPQKRTTSTFVSSLYLFAPPYNVACTASWISAVPLPGATTPDRQYYVLS